MVNLRNDLAQETAENGAPAFGVEIFAVFSTSPGLTAAGRDSSHPKCGCQGLLNSILGRQKGGASPSPSRKAALHGTDLNDACYPKSGCSEIMSPLPSRMSFRTSSRSIPYPIGASML